MPSWNRAFTGYALQARPLSFTSDKPGGHFAAAFTPFEETWNATRRHSTTPTPLRPIYGCSAAIVVLISNSLALQ
jgi:hypothetical protein